MAKKTAKKKTPAKAKPSAKRPHRKAAKPAPKPRKPAVSAHQHAAGPRKGQGRDAAKVGLSKKEKEQFKSILLKLREKVTGQISFLSDDSLNRMDDTPTEDRTDDFDREFALNLVSSEHDALFEIDEALRRLDEGTYGACDLCRARIERARLQALPFAKLCVRCQSETEKGRAKYRPFGTTISQAVERPAEPGSAPAEEEEPE